MLLEISFPYSLENSPPWTWPKILKPDSPEGHSLGRSHLSGTWCQAALHTSLLSKLKQEGKFPFLHRFAMTFSNSQQWVLTSKPKELLTFQNLLNSVVKERWPHPQPWGIYMLKGKYQGKQLTEIHQRPPRNEQSQLKSFAQTFWHHLAVRIWMKRYF